MVSAGGFPTLAKGTTQRTLSTMSSKHLLSIAVMIIKETLRDAPQAKNACRKFG
jgi:hypothetical protein